MPNDLMLNDGFSNAHDPTASPIRGTGYRFKDGDYYAFSEQVDVDDKSYVVLGRIQGWQKLEAGCPPEYLTWQPGEARPPRPHVAEADWPLNFNGQPEHPFKLTWYLHLVDADTGEFCTFWTNTTGGNVAVGNLSDQVKEMRRVRPNAVPVIALQSREMPTQYGTTKPRPHFHILGWRAGPQDEPLQITAETPATKLEQFAAEAPAEEKPVEKKPVAEKPVAARTTPKPNKRGVVRTDIKNKPIGGKPISEPTLEEILGDQLPDELR
jgi:hypothetical protein